MNIRDERDNLLDNTELNETPSIPGFEALSRFFGSTEDVVARYSHCAICGANLHFAHVTDFTKNLTQETSRCPECGVQASKATHRLQ